MKNIISIIVIILVIIGGYFLVNKKQEPQNDQSIKIGSIAALTGIGVTIGEEELKGVQLAIKEINDAGGIGGRHLELISEDVSIDKLKNTATVAYKLINVDKVVAIVGPQWDEPMLAILPIVEQNKIPIIGPDTTDAVETNGLGDYLFSTWYDNRVGVDVLLKFAQSKGWKTATVIRPLDAGFWQFTSNEFVKNAPKYGIAILEDIDMGNPLLTDYRTFIVKAKKKQPDMIFTITADPNQCIFFKQMKELEFKVPVLATESAGNRASLEQCADVMTNLYFSTPSPDHGKYRDFEKSFVDVYGRKPFFPSAVTAYDAVKILADALEKTGGKGGETLQKALLQTKDFKGASLPNITFKDNGFVKTPSDAFVIMNIQNGQFIKLEQ